MNTYDEALKSVTNEAQKLITDLQFNACLKEYVPNLRDYFNRKSTDSIVPELLVVEPLDETGKHPSSSIQGIADSPFSNDLRQRMRVAGQQAHQKGLRPVATFLIFEAEVEQIDEKELTSEQRRLVDQYDTQKEILMVAGMTIDKRTNLATMDIQRVKGNKIWLRNPTFELYDSDSDVKIDANLLGQFYAGYFQQVSIDKNRGISDRTQGWSWYATLRWPLRIGVVMALVVYVIFRLLA